MFLWILDGSGVTRSGLLARQRSAYYVAAHQLRHKHVGPVRPSGPVR